MQADVVSVEVHEVTLVCKNGENWPQDNYSLGMLLLFRMQNAAFSVSLSFLPFI